MTSAVTVADAARLSGRAYRELTDPLPAFAGQGDRETASGSFDEGRHYYVSNPLNRDVRERRDKTQAYFELGKVHGYDADWSLRVNVNLPSSSVHLGSIVSGRPIVMQIWTAGDQAIVAFRGTVPTNPSDLYADMQLAMLHRPGKVVSATGVLNLAQQYIEEIGKSVKGQEAILQPITAITYTGHSLGGDIAQHCAKAHAEDDRPEIQRISSQFMTFNAPGIAVDKATAALGNGINVVLDRDIVRLAGGRHYGPVYTIAAPTRSESLWDVLRDPLRRPREALDAHRMDRMIEELAKSPIADKTIAAVIQDSARQPDQQRFTRALPGGLERANSFGIDDPHAITSRSPTILFTDPSQPTMTEEVWKKLADALESSRSRSWPVRSGRNARLQADPSERDPLLTPPSPGRAQTLPEGTPYEERSRSGREERHRSGRA